MHPRVFLDNLWRSDIRNEVFVAMPFGDRFDARWSDIFQPSIEQTSIGSQCLSAIRVDARQSGDSILTDIMDGIAHSQLVLADLSASHSWIKDDQVKWEPNGNVMYEVGLALACRQPVEVLLVRDNASRPLLFDLTTIPVLAFDADDVRASVQRISSAITDRLRERELIKDLRLHTIIESLSTFEISLISTNSHQEYLGWTGTSLPAAVAMALPSLLEKRVLRLAQLPGDKRPAVYTWTTLGRTVASALAARYSGQKKDSSGNAEEQQIKADS